jgi:DNA primase
VIAKDTIAAVRERTDIVQLIGESVRLQKQGRRWVGCCPFHKEKTPSFSVSRENGLFHCFGCKESGTAIDFVMKTDGLSFPEAVRALAERAGIAVVEEGGRRDATVEERRRREKEELYAVAQMAAVFFEAQLAEGGHALRHLALAELDKRGLLPGRDAAVDAALAAFRVGYAPYGWDGLAKYFEKQGASPAAAEALGLCVPRRGSSGHYDAFRHRLMFAVLDKTGRVIAFSGRALPEPDEAELQRLGIAPMGRGDRDPPKYVNSPESPIYLKGETVFGLYQARQAIRESGRAVLVEGNFDVLALHARGLGNVVAPLGTAFTPAQARLVKRYAPQMVVMFDGDAAGRKATVAARVPAREGELTVRVAELPAGTDPDDLARKKGIAAVAALVKNAKGMLDWLLDRTLDAERVDGASLQERQSMVRQAIAFIAEEPDPDLRLMGKAYADRVAPKFVIDGQSPADLTALQAMLERSLGAVDKGPKRTRKLGEGPQARSRPHPPSTIALMALGALLDFPDLLQDPAVESLLGELDGEVALAVATVRRMWDAKKSLVASELLDLLPQAIHVFAVGRLAAPGFETIEEARAELVENIEKLRQRSLAGDKAIKIRELERADRLGDAEAQDEFLRELKLNARRKRGLS